MVSGQSHHTFRKSGTVNYPTKLARVICHSLWMPKSYLMTYDQGLACAYYFDSLALALGIGFATTLGLSAAEVSMRDVARRWIGRLLDVIEKLFLV